MIANELRIGNWFLNAAEEPEQVEELTQHLINGYFHEACYPVPLTHEILVKCGFAFDQKSDSFNLDMNSDAYGYLSLDAVDFSFSVDTELNGDGVAGNVVGGLHSLQNLIYSLTGRELIIEL